MSDGAWIAVITGTFGLLTTIAALYFKNKFSLAQLSLELSETRNELAEQIEENTFAKSVLDPMISIPAWSEVSAKINHFMHHSDMKRIILFVCLNGHNDPKETTAIYQWRTDPSHFRAYIGVDLTIPFDNGDYIWRLKQTKRDGTHEIAVSDLLPCLIKKVYDEEEVKYAIWYWACSVPSLKTKQVAGIYMSGASNLDKPISEKEKQELQTLVWEIRNILKLSLNKAGLQVD